MSPHKEDDSEEGAEEEALEGSAGRVKAKTDVDLSLEGSPKAKEKGVLEEGGDSKTFCSNQQQE
jgi:hypothetical protein